MKEDYIVVEHAVKKYKDTIALNDVSLTFAQNQIHGIIGRNGSGKTVLLKCICGLTRLTSGRIILDGKVVGKDMEIPDNIGAIIETPGFIKSFSGYDNLKYLASVRKMIGKEEIVSAMEKAGLDPAMKKHVGKYSLGMRQRLGIAQAIMEKPDILILDEPTAGLDVIARDELLDMLREFLEEDDERSILISSHISSDLESLCDDLYMIHDGKIILHEDTDILLSNYALLKVDDKQYEALDKSYILRVKKESYGYSCLTNERQYYLENYPNITIEAGSIDELITMMIRGK